MKLFIETRDTFKHSSFPFRSSTNGIIPTYVGPVKREAEYDGCDSSHSKMLHCIKDVPKRAQENCWLGIVCSSSKNVQ